MTHLWTRHPRHLHSQASRGFTLLELLVVVAILALLAGAVITSYEGLENKTSEGLAAFNIAALDGLIRQYATTNGSLYPDGNDSLMFSSTGTGTNAVALNVMNQDKLIKRLGPYALTAADVDALKSIGITTSRYVSNTPRTYDNGLPPRAGGTGTQPPTPNRVFDDATASEFGWGVPVALTAGVKVAAVAVGDGTDNIIPSFSTTDTDPTTSAKLNELFGLPATTAHLVVVFGIGNKSTLVQAFSSQLDARSRGAGLSQAPYYSKVKPWEYGRFLACFLIAYDSDGNGTFDKYLDKPRFLTCLDGRGGCLDEENAEWRGTQD